MSTKPISIEIDESKEALFYLAVSQAKILEKKTNSAAHIAIDAICYDPLPVYSLFKLSDSQLQIITLKLQSIHANLNAIKDDSKNYALVSKKNISSFLNSEFGISTYTILYIDCLGERLDKKIDSFQMKCAVAWMCYNNLAYRQKVQLKQNAKIDLTNFTPFFHETIKYFNSFCNPKSQRISNKKLIKKVIVSLNEFVQRCYPKFKSTSRNVIIGYLASELGYLINEIEYEKSTSQRKYRDYIRQTVKNILSSK